MAAPLAVQAALANPIVKKVAVKSLIAIAGATAGKIVDQQKDKFSNSKSRRAERSRIRGIQYDEFVKHKWIKDRTGLREQFQNGGKL